MVLMLTSRSVQIRHRDLLEGNDISQLNAHPRLRDIYVHGSFPISGPLCPLFQSLEDLSILPRGNSPWRIPDLPVLRNLVINCDDESCSIFLDLTKLLRLASFELWSYDHGLTIRGQSQSLRKVHIVVAHVDLDFRQFGQNIEEVDIFASGLSSYRRHTRMHLPRLKSLTLTNSISFLPFLFPTHPSVLEEVCIEVGEQDLFLGELLELLDLQKGTNKWTKHDDSLTTFSERVQNVIESVEWPVDLRIWEKNVDSGF